MTCKFEKSCSSVEKLPDETPVWYIVWFWIGFSGGVAFFAFLNIMGVVK